MELDSGTANLRFYYVTACSDELCVRVTLKIVQHSNSCLIPASVPKTPSCLERQVKNFLFNAVPAAEVHPVCCRCTPSPCAPPGSWPVRTLPLAITWLVVGLTTSAPFTTWKLVKGMSVSAVSSLGTQVGAAAQSQHSENENKNPLNVISQ